MPLIKLCVCNPTTGAVHILPPLGGKDGLGYYACTVFTAEDASLIMIYTRREFTAFRSYSSEDGKWSKEAKVRTNARLSEKQMGLMHSGVVLVGQGRGVSVVAQNAGVGGGKHLVGHVARGDALCCPVWLPVTYDNQSELLHTYNLLNAPCIGGGTHRN